MINRRFPTWIYRPVLRGLKPPPIFKPSVPDESVRDSYSSTALLVGSPIRRQTYYSTPLLVGSPIRRLSYSSAALLVGRPIRRQTYSSAPPLVGSPIRRLSYSSSGSSTSMVVPLGLKAEWSNSSSPRRMRRMASTFSFTLPAESSARE